MTKDPGRSLATHLAGVYEDPSPKAGLLRTLANSVGTMVAVGIFVLSRVVVSNGDLRD